MCTQKDRRGYKPKHHSWAVARFTRYPVPSSYFGSHSDDTCRSLPTNLEEHTVNYFTARCAIRANANSHQLAQDCVTNPATRRFLS
ncbi:hypothetical protein CEXT_755071 [Caerostris extrusa]|uniref:Uncharacterized protein n=1 Tax=Caerostris extrusa TaxID=172846 RepID=A0AAV4UCX3_CAEEX|nr:hypothetical protein CEXT_755071 [Caerostris extrusa]